MTNAEILIASATLLGPVAAVQVQKFIERAQARRRRKEAIFYALMSNRGSPLAPDSIHALNMIEIEFAGRRFFGRKRQSVKEEAVMLAWTGFFAHINTPAVGDRWGEQFNDLLFELLVAMGHDLDYSLRPSDLKWHTYAPKGIRDDEVAVRQLRLALTQVLNGERVLPVEVRSINLPGQVPPALAAAQPASGAASPATTSASD